VLEPSGRLIALERAVSPGARGLAAHGLTDPAADELVRLAARNGFEDVGKRSIRVGRRNLVAVVARAPAE
jgi:hypothetical protein